MAVAARAALFDEALLPPCTPVWPRSGGGKMTLGRFDLLDSSA